MSQDKIDKGDVQKEGFGYTVEGDWDEIADFGEKVIDAFEENEVEKETITEWDSWRPRSGEREPEMQNKTVEKAKVEEGEDPQEMAEAATQHLSKTTKKTAQLKMDEAAEQATESAKSTGKAMDGASRGLMRRLEDPVYKRITKYNPMYFDSEEFNASLEVIRSLPDRIRSMFNRDTGEKEYKITIKPETDEVEDALDTKFEVEQENE